MKTFFSFLIVALLFQNVLVAFASNSHTNTRPGADDIPETVSLEKTTYVYGEDIVGTFTVQNNSEGPVEYPVQADWRVWDYELEETVFSQMPHWDSYAEGYWQEPFDTILLPGESYSRNIVFTVDGTFYPEIGRDYKLSRSNVGGVPFNVVAEADDLGDSGFWDIGAHWARNDIEALYNMGIVSGRTSYNFEPSANITRAEFLKMVLEIADIEISDLNSQFSDVPPHAWYADYIGTADQRYGILNGEDGKFYPDREINRAEAMTLLMRVVNPNEYAEATDGMRFQDLTTREWFWPYVNTAARYEILTGYDEPGFPFKPTYNMTRAEAAAVIYRAYNAFYKYEAPWATDISGL